MADGIRAGIDPHTSNAASWKVERPSAKTGIFGKLYGAQAEKMSKTLKCSVEEAQAIIDSIDKNMPAIQELMEKVWTVGRKRGGDIYTLFGQRLRYPDLNSKSKWKRQRAQRQCFNALIQGTAAAIQKELTLRALPIIKKYGGKISFAVHDETGAYIPTTKLQECLQELNLIYTCTDILSKGECTVPITGLWNAGRHWNEAKAG